MKQSKVLWRKSNFVRFNYSVSCQGLPQGLLSCVDIKLVRGRWCHVLSPLPHLPYHRLNFLIKHFTAREFPGHGAGPHRVVHSAGSRVVAVSSQSDTSRRTFSPPQKQLLYSYMHRSFLNSIKWLLRKGISSYERPRGAIGGNRVNQV